MTADLSIVGTGGLEKTPGAPLHVAGGSIVARREVGPLFDGTGLYAAPGFIDIQVNGGFGRDFTADPRTIWEVAALLPRFGVTAFLPTLVSPTPDVVVHAKQVLRSGPPDGWRGSWPLGIHCEGPMISLARRGAHPAAHVVEPSIALLDAWGGGEHISMVTIAPELPGADPIIDRLTCDGVIVSLGHSDSDFETAWRALVAGAGAGTHLFNAMSGLDHRAPGLAAALLAHPAAVVGVIVDGIHVDPAMVALSAGLLGPGRLALVTDAMAGAGRGPGTYRLGGVEVTVVGDRVTTVDGVLAGSVLTMDRAVRNLADYTGWSLADVVASASTTPARLLGDETRGCLEPGRRGDVVLLDEGLNVKATVIGGEVVFDDR